MARHVSKWARLARRVAGEDRWEGSAVAKQVAERDVEPAPPRPTLGTSVTGRDGSVRKARVNVSLGAPAPLLMRIARRKMILDKGFFKRETLVEGRVERPERVAFAELHDESKELRVDPVLGNPLRGLREKPDPRGMRVARPFLPGDVDAE